MNKLGRLFDVIRNTNFSPVISNGEAKLSKTAATKTLTNTSASSSSIPPMTNPSSDDIVTLAEIEANTKQTSDDPCIVCSNPCPDHDNYPRYLKIDQNSILEGTVKPYYKHVIISTGKSDWPDRIEDDTDTLASSLTCAIKAGDKQKGDLSSKKKEKKKSRDKNEPDPLLIKIETFGGQSEKPRIVITNSSRLNSDHASFSTGNDILLYPENLLVRKVKPMQAVDFYERFLANRATLHQDKDNSDDRTSIVEFQIEPVPYKAVILICSHRHRDKRCGVTAPLLKTELDSVLKKKGLDLETRPIDGVGVFMTSHIGGHKFAGNLIVYRDGQGIWYGRVTPCHARAIIETTVIEGKVIKDLYRGAMNGSFTPGKNCGKLEW
ncbi:hypothetical protein G9A89_002455 [Geosiphon pyriformis]|nr:hypothetical protein G9A89_002455 [Geosiphon pyriformis]